MKQALRILGNSLIWATVIIATASALKGTAYLHQILPIMGGGAAGTLILSLGANKTKTSE
ncbi:hypothetical protein KQH65_09390 [archaeon]|nr:hypothetical protein [archaeon]